MGMPPPPDEKPRRRANPDAFAWAFLMAVVVTIAGILIVAIALGPPGSAEGLGRVFGRFAFPALVAALITSLIARRSRQVWAWWHYLPPVASITVGFLMLAAMGQMNA
ncbi:hypothetical protein [Actinopolymorpha sp. B9G3]|uniref:hypothetical protein n=1 Tax=Actinopolymorpha sp. B9G3 TaxID=3158970 RepID=UPI0032D8F393